MRFKFSYSEFTECPECHAGVYFGRIVFGREFACPQCAKELHISPRYKRNLDLASWLLGLLVPYLIGVRSWFLLLFWIPCAMEVSFIWVLVGMRFLPPRLEPRSEHSVFKPPSILGLGPK